tara:strand:- start:482 stop:604 length:123 start_codon:yes stop_codon:yes gene_type:complete
VTLVNENNFASEKILFDASSKIVPQELNLRAITWHRVGVK